MLNFLKSQKTQLPEGHWITFGNQLYKENLFRLILYIGVFFLIEMVGLALYSIAGNKAFMFSPILLNSVYYIEIISLPYLLTSIILYRKKKWQISLSGKLFLYSYLLIVLSWTMIVSILMADQSIYVVGILSISAVFYMMPDFSFALLAIVYFLYFYFERNFSSSPDMISILLFRMAVINVIGWIFMRNSIRSRIKIFNDTLKIHEQNDLLKELSIRDSMTGLFNHKHSYELLESEIVRSKRYQHSLSVLLLDLDHFKQVNDTYGHQAGDEVLKSISKILKDNSRETDIIGRYGGEEFIIIMPETDLKNGSLFAERLRKTIKEFDFNQPPHVTISAGMSKYREDDTAETIVKRSDLLLYQAKENGRNRIEMESTLLSE